MDPIQYQAGGFAAVRPVHTVATAFGISALGLATMANIAPMFPAHSLGDLGFSGLALAASLASIVLGGAIALFSSVAWNRRWMPTVGAACGAVAVVLLYLASFINTTIPNDMHNSMFRPLSLKMQAAEQRAMAHTPPLSFQ